MAFMQTPLPVVSHTSRSQGFTLLELLTVIGLMTTLLMVASPWLQQYLWRLQVESVTQSWSADLQAARLQAVRTGQAVRLQRLHHCQALPMATGDWRCGWQLLKKINNPPLLWQTALAGEVLVSLSPAQNSLDINASGEPVVGGLRVVFQTSHRLPMSSSRVVCINVAGRLRVAQGNSCS